jgi:hypothetical protein
VQNRGSRPYLTTIIRIRLTCRHLQAAPSAPAVLLHEHLEAFRRRQTIFKETDEMSPSMTVGSLEDDLNSGCSNLPAPVKYVGVSSILSGTHNTAASLGCHTQDPMHSII